MDFYKKLELDEIIKNKDFKEDELGNGTLFYKHLSQLGEDFWLHTFFHKASQEEINDAKNVLLKKANVFSSMGIDELFSLLKNNNGFQLFSNSLILYGITDKVDYRFLSEPNSIIKNNSMLPKYVNTSWITIGYCSLNSSTNLLIFVDAALSRTNCFSAVVSGSTIKVIHNWNSIEDMLSYCIEKFKKHYSLSGYKIDADYTKSIIVRNKTYID